MKMTSLNDLLLEELKELYTAERRIRKALPKMEKAASSGSLRKAFARHIGETDEQIERLRTIFQELGRKADTRKAMGIKGVLADGRLIMAIKGDPRVLDEGLIGAAQHVEHFEIAGYVTARTHAHLLGLKNVTELLDKTIAEEKQMNEELSDLAQGMRIRVAKAA